MFGFMPTIDKWSETASTEPEMVMFMTYQYTYELCIDRSDADCEMDYSIISGDPSTASCDEVVILQECYLSGPNDCRPSMLGDYYFASRCL